MSLNLRHAEVLREGKLPGGNGTIEVLRLANSRIAIRRFAQRGKVTTVIDKREVHKGGESQLQSLTPETANLVFDRIVSGESMASCVVFHEGEMPRSMVKTPREHQFTSTGKKFWRHPEQMKAYRQGGGHSIISTHVSPEGACNLKCPYCSVTYRDTHSRIELDRIQDYIEKLQSRGLKAVILTGGGEPTAYRQFDELVTWLKYERGLSVALITNGTLSQRVSKEAWGAFSWIRVSINVFDGWQETIRLPVADLAEDCVVGCSMVYTAEHEATAEMETDRYELLQRVSSLSTELGARYIRLLPNCSLDSCTLLAQHAALEKVLDKVDDPRFLHQHKMHRTPKSHTCHQAYFRPYLGEEPWRGDGRPGSVYPCDSVVLNDGVQFFPQKYQLCRPEDILDFLDGKLDMTFDPTKHCSGCVFTDNIDLLEDWKNGSPDRFAEHREPMLHEEFP
ncbi:MAG: radical SAM protein [Deltaproteobacteria bacterium]|nr:radical SAM protein [Deltaproteobacteria bacterium]